MTYEEKLDKIVQKLKYERDLTRKGHTSQLSYTDASFTKLSIREVCQIILQLQDDEKVVKITEAIQPMETVSTEEIINHSSRCPTTITLSAYNAARILNPPSSSARTA